MKKQIFDLKNVGVCYRKGRSLPWKQNRFWALKAVSFQVYRGETVGIVGRNGAGKSTLLKVLAGIIHPDCGCLNRADVSVTMQSVGAGFDLRLSGRQNIILNGLLLGMDKRRVTEKTDEIIQLTDIGEFIDEPIHSYSSGMRARLGFSIAYYIETDVILIDEALAVGDQAFKEKASELIKKKIKSDHTVILATHSTKMLDELCDRVIHIEDGRSLEELSVEQTIERYLGVLKNEKC